MALAIASLGGTLTHRNPAIRVGVAWVIGVGALLTAWLLSYRYLPEGPSASRLPHTCRSHRSARRPR